MDSGIHTRLPRTRGDGPDHTRSYFARLEASPHSRGWTCRLLFGLGLKLGFPALAGMDLSPEAESLLRWGLPRTRGDGPTVANSGAWLAEASPHSRGWTLNKSVTDRVTEGFPALAGMDLRTGSSATSRTWLPRTRGDGPFSQSELARQTRASPHSRGWTHQ